MPYSPKTWALSDPITATDLNRIEEGIATVTDGLNETDALISVAPSLIVTSNNVVAVSNNIVTYNCPNPHLVVADITPAVNSRLVIVGYVTLLHSVLTATPDLSWGLVDGTSGALLRQGAKANRSRESQTMPVAIPLSASFNLTAGTRTLIHLGVSASVAGDVTIQGNGCSITGIVLPR